MSDVAIVTGGAGGIGAAVVRRLAADGRTVIAADLPDALRASERLDGEGVHTHPLDVRRPADAEAAIAFARKHGPLTTVVNVAGVLRPAPLAEMGDDDLGLSLGVNLAGTMHVIRAAIPQLGEGAAIVNISSIAGESAGAPGVSAYAATKGAINALTRALACELGPRGVRVNAVAPGYVNAPMAGTLRSGGDDRLARRVPLRRLGEPEEIAEVVAFLASPRAAYVSGAVLPVDGGALAT